jgi:hypothetical protein
MKKFLEFTLKFILFFASVYFLMLQFNQKEIAKISIDSKNRSIYLLIGSLFILNWFLEIYKWKILIAPIQIISIKESCKQTFIAFIASPFLPAKLGEYVVKTNYFAPKDKEKIIIAHFLINFFQLTVTMFFGIIGLAFLVIKEAQLLSKIYLIIGLIIIGILLLFVFKRIPLFGYYFQIIYNKFYFFSSAINQRVLLFSGFRYLVFLHQFYFFLLFFGVDLPYFQSVIIIASMYILASILPSFSLLDLTIKGSISVYLFSFFTNDIEKILFTSGSMWVFNTILPMVIGWVLFIFNKFNFK